MFIDCADENNFRCWDGSCISKVNKCDGKVDCPNDNSDEVECGEFNLSYFYFLFYLLL